LLLLLLLLMSLLESCILSPCLLLLPAFGSG